MNIQERIILYILGTLSESEVKEVEQAIEANPTLKLQVEATQKAIEDFPLHDYLEGELPEQKVKELEQQLATNPTLAKALDTYESLYYITDQVVLADVDLSIDKSIHQDFQAIHAAQQTSTEKPIRRLRPWYMLAAAAVLVIAVGVAIVFFRSAYHHETIAMQVFEMHSASNFLKSTGTVPEQSFLKGLYELEGGDYEAAINQLSQVVENDSTYANALFFLGNAYVGAARYQEALQTFNALQLDQSIQCTLPDCLLKIQWYSALAYLALGKEGDARILLMAIKQVATDKYYRERAEQTLKRLDSFWYH